MAAGAEGMMLGAVAGIDPAVLNQVVRNSSGNSMGFRAVAKKSLEQDWEPSFALDLAYKDMHLALELADELGLSDEEIEGLLHQGRRSVASTQRSAPSRMH